MESGVADGDAGNESTDSLSQSSVSDQPGPYNTTLIFDRENGVPLSPFKRQSIVITHALARVFARALSLENGQEPPLSFITLLIAMLMNEDMWLRNHFEAQRVRIDDIFARKKFDEKILLSLNEPTLRDEYWTTESARAALEEAERIARRASGGPTIDFRHLCAAYAILPNWHLRDFAELEIDRLDWARAFGAETARRFPTERAYWRGYADRASPVPLTSFSADVYTEEDLLDIDRSVDALALLIASTRTVTPLAIGVFGPWGSGKTFFMRHLQKQIVDIGRKERAAIEAWNLGRKEDRARAEDAPLYYGEIAQVEFNAWHYNEANLVASLVEHVFRNLRVLPDEDDYKLEKRRTDVLRKLEGLTSDLAFIDDVIAEAEQKIQDARAEVKRTTEEAEDAKNDVGALAREIEAQITSSREKFDRERAGLDNALQLINSQVNRVDPGAVIAVALEPFVGDVRKTISSIHDQTLDWGNFFKRVFSGKGVWVILLCVIGPIVLWVTNVLGKQLATLAGSCLTASAITVKAFDVLKRFRAQFVEKLDKLEQEQRSRAEGARKLIENRYSELTERATEDRNRFNAALKAQNTSLAEREKLLDDAARELARRAREHDEKLAQRVEAQKRVRDAEAELKRLSSALLLEEFIKDRSSTDEYRKQLGFLALVRRDIERLSKLIDRSNRIWLDPGNKQPGPLLNRIVLYIDDLDRCKESTVLAVLEAVHLLLAFPLFVCAVAVDPRWVEKCLRKTNRQLFTDEKPKTDGSEDITHATVGDYLEKIFQIPIWMSPIDERARASLVNVLLGPSATPAPQSIRNAQTGVGTSISSGSGVETSPSKVLGEKGLARPDPLRIAPEEAAYVEEIAALLSDRPRALKRFVNVYRLLKASLPDIDRDSFVSDDPSSGYRICLSQLALFTGHPRLAPPLVTALESRYRGAYENEGVTLTSEAEERISIEDWYNTLNASSQANLRGALALIPNRATVRLEEFRRWLPLTSRYLFHRAD